MKITETIQTRIASGHKKVRWPQEFRFVLLGAIVLFPLAVFGESLTFLQPLRIILGLAYALMIPGYCLTAAIFPPVGELNRVERIGLGIAFSIVADSILALLLDRLPWGISFWSVLIGIYGMTGLFIAVALWRRSNLSTDVVHPAELTWSPQRWWSSQSDAERGLYKLLMAFSLLIAALAIGLLLGSSADQYTTEFYMLGKNGLVADYPYTVRIEDPVTVTVGVVNREKKELNYHFEVWQIDSFDADKRNLLTRSNSFSLRPGESYEQSLSWQMPRIGDQQEVEFLLYYNNDLVPSRRLRMRVDVQNKQD